MNTGRTSLALEFNPSATFPLTTFFMLLTGHQHVGANSNVVIRVSTKSSGEKMTFVVNADKLQGSI